jgi:hypothetical protein
VYNQYLSIILKSNNKTLEITKDTLYKLIDIDGIESAEFKLNLTSNSQFDGSVVNSKRIDKRAISIISEYTGASKEIERKKLISFFNPKNTGSLVINYGDLERTINYEIEGFNSKINNINENLTFTVDLICANPFWSEIQGLKEEIALWIGDFEFPLELIEGGIEMGHREPNLIVNVVNECDVGAGMRIEFRALATLANPSLLNVNTGEFIKINKEMVAGEVLTVTTYLRNKNNLFRYNSDTNLDNLEVSIYFSPQYLGV